MKTKNNNNARCKEKLVQCAYVYVKLMKSFIYIVMESLLCFIHLKANLESY